MLIIKLPNRLATTVVLNIRIYKYVQAKLVAHLLCGKESVQIGIWGILGNWSILHLEFAFQILDDHKLHWIAVSNVFGVTV